MQRQLRRNKLLGVQEEDLIRFVLLQQKQIRSPLVIFIRMVLRNTHYLHLLVNQTTRTTNRHSSLLLIASQNEKTHARQPHRLNSRLHVVLKLILNRSSPHQVQLLLNPLVTSTHLSFFIISDRRPCLLQLSKPSLILILR